MPERSCESQGRTNSAERIAALSPEKRALLRKRSATGTVNGEEAIADCLHRLGITHVYSVSGGPISGILPALARHQIRVVGVHHQQAAVCMAAAQNYVAGRMTAAVIVSAGPAVTNTATGILVAYDNCWPVLVLGGRRPLRGHGMEYFQELEAVPIFDPITKWSATVPTTNAIPSFLQQAVQRSVSGRPGPVFVELPEDVIFNEVSRPDLEDLSGAAASPGPCDEKLIAEAIDLLRRAERPLVIIGKGVRWSVPFDLLRGLIEQLEIPFITSPMGRGFVSDDHPLCCNAIRSFAQTRADVILVLGARLNWMFRYGDESAHAKIIQVDIEREELGRNCDPAVALHGDAGECTRQLVRSIGRHALGNLAQKGSWYRRISAAKREKDLKSSPPASTTPMSPDELADRLRGVMWDDTIFVTDGNVSMSAAQRLIPSHRPASRLDAGTNGCMGVGIPFAMGAKLACPDRPVVALCGDHAFALSVMELETCARYRIPIVVIVANNHGLGGALTQRALYPPDYPDRVTMFQHGIRYDDIAQTLGCHSEFVEHPDDLEPAFTRAMRSGRTACINVFIDPEVPLSSAWGSPVIAGSVTED